MRAERAGLRPGAAALLLALCAPAFGQKHGAVNLHVRLTLTPTDDKGAVLQEARDVLEQARASGKSGTLLGFLENLVKQVDGLIQAEEQVRAEAEKVPEAFTSPQMQVKEIRKLRAKKETIQSVTFAELQQKLLKNALTVPLILRDARKFFPDWDATRRQWTEKHFTEDARLAKDFTMPFFEQDQRREARLVGNRVEMPQPKMVSFAGWFNRCFGKSKAPGANTEHCEQLVPAEELASEEALKQFAVFPELNNTLHGLHEFRRAFVAAGSAELPTILGKNKQSYREWQKEKGGFPFRHVVMGPSGSGEKLRAEEGLPFFDVLIHGSRRWLLVKEKELQRVAKLAQEALEFQETTAYMFFEEKLPELKEEFGFTRFLEVNQNAGDVMVVPPGWYRVSLSLADSISYYETMLHDTPLLKAVVEQDVFQPQLNRFDLAFCYSPDQLPDLPMGFNKPANKRRLAEAMRDVRPGDQVQYVVGVLLNCGGVLSLEQAQPHLRPRRLTVCTEQLWRDCRGALVSRLGEAKRTAALDWLPAEAPEHPGGMNPARGATQEEL